jgi:DNA invertase Pin-like site-specific DNA recombinase
VRAATQPAKYGPVRALTPERVASVRGMRALGVRVEAIAAAFEVTKRTVYRYLADDATVVEIRCGEWTARHALRPGSPPWRLERWRLR